MGGTASTLSPEEALKAAEKALQAAEKEKAHLKTLNSYMSQYKNVENGVLRSSKLDKFKANPLLKSFDENFRGVYSEEISKKIKDELQQSETTLEGAKQRFEREKKASAIKEKADRNARMNAWYPKSAVSRKLRSKAYHNDGTIKDMAAVEEYEKQKRVEEEEAKKMLLDTSRRKILLQPEDAARQDKQRADVLRIKQQQDAAISSNPIPVQGPATYPTSAPPPFESMSSNPAPGSAPPPSYNNASKSMPDFRVNASAPPPSYNNPSNTPLPSESSTILPSTPPSQDPSMPPVISITPSEKPKPTFYAPQGISATPIEVPVVENVLNKMDEEHPLWSFTNAFFTIIIMGIVVTATMYGMQALVDIDRIKADWPNQRCSPLIMPFAGFFGHSPKENFDFCMGKIFDGHSTPILGSIGAIFSQFTSLLKSIFNSINSIRNIISSLGGGINVVFQEFTDRITNFFFELRMSAIRLKMLFGRVYATLFSVMYMGLSGITGMSSFTNTFLFSFLDTFCFPGETEIMVLKDNRAVPTPIKEVKIGDVLLPGRTTVTATFRFYSRGQAMVQLGRTVVSTNHYVMYNGKPIMAGEHPHAIQLGPWNSDEHLYCVNTTDHTIPVGGLTFMDYDETPEGDAATLQWIEERINARSSQGKKYPYVDACFAIQEDAKIKTESGLRAAKEIKIGDRLTTGCEVVGVIRRRVSEACVLSSGVKVTPATLYWKDTQWLRYGEHHVYESIDAEFVSFVVTPHSQIELEDGTRVRDYMELCSPDAEMHYTALLESE